MDTIPGPLLDRMEVIEVPSYTEEEKLHIAKKHLLPKQTGEHGLPPKSVRVSDAAMKHIIEGYTREARVPTLSRTNARVLRRRRWKLLVEDRETVSVSPQTVEKFLGAPRYLREARKRCPRWAWSTVWLTHRGRRNPGRGNAPPCRERAKSSSPASWRRDEGKCHGGPFLGARHAAEFDLDGEFHKNLDITPRARGRRAQGRPLRRGYHGDAWSPP
jgi:ATP-dependent Lon protease